MLISEIRGWHWAITWDNPDPPDSSKMLKALNQLHRYGKRYKLKSKREKTNNRARRGGKCKHDKS